MGVQGVAARSRRGMVVFGDSVAEGRDDPDPAGGWIGWSERLADRLNLPYGYVLNVASRGATVADVARGQLPMGRHLRPRLITLGCGMNDVLNGFERAELVGNLAEIFGWARSTGAVVIAASVPAPPLMERSVISEFRRERMRQRIREFNAVVDRSACVFGVTFLGQDTVRGLTDPSLWSSDGIHLNATGHAYVAEVIARITLDLLAEKSISSSSG